METWDPAAARDPFPDSGSFVAGPYRVVLHSTEGGTYGGARAAYQANKVSPHFTVSYEKGRLEVWQHVQLNRAATALEHRAGTVHTNRLSAVQIEVVAFAAKPVWPAGLVTGVADLIAWISQQCGVTPVAPHFEAYPASYGEHNGVRFSDENWLTFNGVCGHQHVPHQEHGDPGAINILALLPGRPVTVQRPTVGPPIVLEVRPMWDPPLQVVDFLPWWHGSGGYMLFADGGIGAVGDAPYREGKQPLGNDYWINRKPARLERLGEEGYVVTATSGERYEYP